MKATYHDKYAIDSDGITVWVHAPSGDCIGRFGRQGIDIHRPIGEQEDGAGECLHCTHGLTTPTEWFEFVEGMESHYGVLPEHLAPHMPQRFLPKR